MKVSDELLAAYAEGHVSDAERDAVRKYLTENPDELETVMIMMDQDFDLSLDNASVRNLFDSQVGKDSYADLCYSAAAFAPSAMPKSIKRPIKPNPGKTSSFKSRLDNLLDELNL